MAPYLFLYTSMYKEESNREERTQSQPGFPSIHLMMNLLILLVIHCLGVDREWEQRKGWGGGSVCPQEASPCVRRCISWVITLERRASGRRSAWPVERSEATWQNTTEDSFSRIKRKFPPSRHILGWDSLETPSLRAIVIRSPGIA